MTSAPLRNPLIAFCVLMAATLPVSGQTLLFQETFNGGAADWVDVDRNPVTHHATGGRNGGAYISMTGDIDSSGGGVLGGYVQFRCAVAPSQMPSQNCSNGGFVGDWYFAEGVKELRYWFRHNSTKPGGIVPTVRVAIPNNGIAGSALFAAVPANTWTQIIVPIDANSPVWDPNWGSLAPNAVEVLRNVGRLQPGIWIDPNAATYQEANVKFDIDDVAIYGSTAIPAEVQLLGTLHPHHNGNPAVDGGLNDQVRVVVFGSSTAAGDPVNLNTDNIVRSTVRIGQLGGPQVGSAYAYNLDTNGDGLEDARFATRTSDLGGSCQAWWAEPTAVAFRAELTTGEVVAGIDETVNVDCDAQCH